MEVTMPKTYIRLTSSEGKGSGEIPNTAKRREVFPDGYVQGRWVLDGNTLRIRDESDVENGTPPNSANMADEPLGGK